MRRVQVAPLASALLLAAAFPTQAADWRPDPARSSIILVIDQGGRTIEARLTRFDGTITFDPAAPETARVELAIDTASFASGDAQRDEIAASREFLSARDHPKARYVTRSLKPLGGDRYEVAADLEVRGVTKPLAHQATITAGPEEASAAGEAEIARVGWGIGAGQFPDGRQVGLAVRVRFDIKAARVGG